MSKTEASINQPVENASSASAGVSDVIGEFASSAWRAGAVRPLQGVAQLAGVDIKPEPERHLTGAMRVAEVAGSAAGTLADIILLSKVVGKGVGALGEAAEIKPLMTDGLAKSLTVSGTTGFVDGFAFNPTQPGEGITNRLAHGIAEGAGFMALDGASRYLGGMSEKALTNGISRTANRIGEAVPTWVTDSGRAVANSMPTWATDAGRSSTDFLMRNAQKGGELLTSRFPHLEAENAMRNALAGATGGLTYYTTDATLNGKNPSFADFESTGLGWAAANVVLGGKLGPGRSAEVKVEPKPEPPPEKAAEAPAKVEPPPPPTYTPETKILEDGSQQWSYKDVPGHGDEVTYTRQKVGDYLSPKLDWQIKTADGKVYDQNTKGPWEIKYPDGALLQKNEWNYLSFNKPISIKIGGKDVPVNEVTQLHPDQKEIAKQWVYEDPAVPNQTVTFDANRNWSAVDANGKSFGPGSEGPWKVTNIDGYVESKAAGAGAEIDVEVVPGLSNWKERVKPAEQDAESGKRRPRVFMISTTDPSPMGLSEMPRTMSLDNNPF
ncbi:MAG: hypothetical protein JST89_15935 [Cyanobacteria bacterium SZAS-4]|nr:hypothetical protein [Cyanobacteria bacterium SZAS-4]